MSGIRKEPLTQLRGLVLMHETDIAPRRARLHMFTLSRTKLRGIVHDKTFSSMIFRLCYAPLNPFHNTHL